MATDNERKTVVAAIKRPETTSSTAEIRRLGKKLLVAALLGRWEELFLHVTKLIRMTLSTVYRVGQSKKERLSRWLFSPLVAEGALPMPWTRSDLPMGPLGRSALFLLRRIKRWQIWLGMLTASWLLVRSARKAQIKKAFHDFKRKRILKREMKESESYEDWSKPAWALEELEGKNKEAAWKRETSLYDRELLEARLSHLRKIREQGDVGEMVYALRADMLRDLGNMTNKELYKDKTTVPQPILDYIEEVELQLQYITHYEFPDFTVEDKIEFLRETRHAFGRTAVVLSGGGALGTFHIGVLKALFVQNLLPRVFSGSSVGSLICAMVCTRSDAELEDLMENFVTIDLTFFSCTSMAQILRHFIAKGAFHDILFYSSRLRVFLGDCTFQEAYDKSGRVLNVCVTAANTNEPPKLLNYLTAPNVVVWSAVAASSAFPFIFKPIDLLAKNRKGEFVKYVNIDRSHCTNRRWRDGSLEEDLPMQGISEMFNVNYFVVSQVNPHIVPWLTMKKVMPPKLSYLIISEWKHRCLQLLEILPAWFPKHIQSMLKCLCQKWEGDVTVWMETSISTYLFMLMNAVMNPTTYSLKLAIMEGERSIWPKLAAIKANCAIEQAMDECMSKLKTKAKSHTLKQRGRIPSWLNADGMSRENSQDSMSYQSDDERIRREKEELTFRFQV
eukprot:CAMPEP_0198234390 /NCGR_PEP_ID=MMETSP1446-20131203/423_1 /TAXON_ID=1461542 ORGANISM="Unidentified sp, Strain CCMP2111" /NCGR_SAMPLE_ID=MMETSP1446 /ASSEMBLY_ACC=CAM_ASM_001112 /LENGTH=673 /DNA_ID=CAMNT_0043915167 /DNA_START=166 /DNA_END=2187 /DNA_ORIENTATION=+